MEKRKSIPKKIRFEVFKRDKFKCQYCGQSAPDVVLHVDHIHPVAEGGGNEIVNLVTSCQACNLGKSNRLLSDDSAIKKQKKQLDELQERREQLEMMMEWHRSLLDLEQYTVVELVEFWKELVPGYTLNDHGVRGLKKLTHKFSAAEIIDAMKTSTAQYLSYEGDPQKPTQVSVEKACAYIEKICASKRKMKEKPYLRQLYYARGILRKRLSHLVEWESVKLMEAAVLAGRSTGEITDYCKETTNWSSFKETMKVWAAEAEDDK